MECPDCGREVHPYTWPDICPHCHAFLCDESIAENLLEDAIEEHNEGKCKCDLTESGYGLCYAGQWLEGVITSKQVVEEKEEVRKEKENEGRDRREESG